MMGNGFIFLAFYRDAGVMTWPCAGMGLIKAPDQCGGFVPTCPSKDGGWYRLVHPKWLILKPCTNLTNLTHLK
jgi:hypothetical protein